MWIGIGLAVIIGGFLVGRFFVVPMVGTVPDNLGWRDNENRFKRCPDFSPNPVTNCVSSTDDVDAKTYIEPIPFTGDMQSAKDNILAIISGMPRHEILNNESNYLHVEFRSLMWGFQDDTEFYFDADNSVIHVRSAARLGQGDLDANRNRVNSIREQFEG